MRIKEHWPEFIQDVLEFNYLDKALEPEFIEIRGDTSRLVEDILVNTAPASIIARYEKILGLEADTDMAIRRYNILNKLSNRTPFTISWLIEKLDALLGKENYTCVVNGNVFEIVIEVDISCGHILSSVQTQFVKQIPANMVFTPKLKITASTIVEVNLKPYRFEPPICELITGVYPYIACIGKIDSRTTHVASNAYEYLFDPEITGMIPDISTIGKVSQYATQINSVAAEYLFNPDITGTKPDKHMIGEIDTNETLTGGNREVIPFSYKLCDTIICGT